jgi:hypothetical protein
VDDRHLPSAGGITPEIALLNRLIEHDPALPVHYLLRGEEWLACGRPDRARVDFLSARNLARGLFAQADWGYLYQAYVDRAEAGLRECQ